MIDPVEAVIQYLLDDAPMAALVGGRVAARQQYGEGWQLPNKALQVRLDSGQPELYVEDHLVRLELRAYGESHYEASKIWLRLVAISRALARATTVTSQGTALVRTLLMDTVPSMLHDPDLDVDFLLWFMTARVAETAVA